MTPWYAGLSPPPSSAPTLLSWGPCPPFAPRLSARPLCALQATRAAPSTWEAVHLDLQQATPPLGTSVSSSEIRGFRAPRWSCWRAPSQPPWLCRRRPLPTHAVPTGPSRQLGRARGVLGRSGDGRARYDPFLGAGASVGAATDGGVCAAQERPPGWGGSCGFRWLCALGWADWLGLGCPAATTSGLEPVWVSTGPRAVYVHEAESCCPGWSPSPPTAPWSLLKLATKRAPEPQSTVLI